MNSVIRIKIYWFISKCNYKLNHFLNILSLMGQTCDSCVTKNIEFIPQGNMLEQNVQKLVASLKYQILLQQSHQNLKSYTLNQDTLFLGHINNENKKQGYGQLKSLDRMYAGNFYNNLPHGKGLLQIKDYLYHGTFSQGKPHGQGQQKNNQLQFIGQFSNGQKIKGNLVHPQYIYQGQFKDNLFDGKGKINYFLKGVNYHGQFKQGKFHGEGLISFKDHHKYQGNFKDGNYHGKGLMLSEAGQIFQGSFQSGVKHGHGWVKTTDGHQMFVEWRNNERHGKGTIQSEGHSIEVQWDQGKLIHSTLN